jgi:hypothetical protein
MFPSRPPQLVHRKGECLAPASTFRGRSKRSSFRIVFHMYYLEHMTPGISCINVNYTTSGVGAQCVDHDTFNANELAAVKSTLENLQTFLHDLIKAKNRPVQFP